MKSFDKLNVQHLISFCQVAQSLNLSSAAQALGLSQPTLSRQMASLQHYLGQSLYERKRHGIQLTADGKALQPYACALARQFEETRAFLHKQSLLELRFGLSHHLITRYTATLLHTIKALKQRHSNLQVHLLEGYSSQLFKQLQEQHLDAAIIVSTDLPHDNTLSRYAIGKDDICLLCLPDDPIAHEEKLSFAQVKDETLLLSSADSQVYQTVLEKMRQGNIQPDRLIEVSGPAAVRTAVMAGQGIGVMVRSFVKPEVEAGWLRCIPLAEEGVNISLQLIQQQAATLGISKHHLLEALRNPLAAPNPEESTSTNS